MLDSIHSAYAFWLIVSGAITLILSFVVWNKRPAPGALALTVALMSMTIWAWSYASLWLDTSDTDNLLWANLAIVGIAIAPTSGLILITQFTGRGRYLTTRLKAALMVVPAMTIIIAWTDPYHQLFYGQGSIAEIEGLSDLGPWPVFYVAYAYSLVVMGIFMLAQAYRKASGFFRGQLTIVMFGMVLPWLANILTISGLIPWPGLDLTPFAFSINGAFLAYGIFSYRLMDLVPVSRDALVENLEDGILVVDAQGCIVDINPRALEMVGLAESPLGRPVEELFARWGDSVERYDLMRGRFQVSQQEGPFYWLDVRIIPIHDVMGNARGHIASLRDISPEVQAADKTRVFLHVVDQNPGAIYITNPRGQIEYVNKKLVELSGYPALEMLGHTAHLFRSGETAEQTYTEMWATITSGESWEGDLLNRRKDGELYWVHELIAPVKDESGVITHFIATDQEITDRKHTEAELRVANTRLQFQLTQIENLHQQLREESIRDGLTRLFNRSYMEETLEREIQTAQRRPMPISVVMMDVDLFKAINDSFGHQAGDTVLQTLGTLLIEQTRASDVACRYGGDEMVVVLSGATSADALVRADEWRQAFENLEITFGLQGVKTTLSLGVATYPEHGRNPAELLGAADKALYVAKARRNSASVYVPDSLSPSETQKIEV